MATFTTFSEPILRYLLPLNTKILIPIIYFRVKTTDIDKKYDIYSRTCVDGSYILEVVDFTVSYALVASIRYLHITTAIASD